MKWNNTSKILLAVLVLIVILAFATGSRVERLVTDLFTVEFNNESEDKERIKELESRLAEIEQEKREQELVDKIAELEKKLKKNEKNNQIDKPKPPKEGDKKSKKYDLSGKWKDKNTGGHYTIHQFGDKRFSFKEVSYPFGVETVTAVGEGVIDNNKTTVNYTTIFQTPGQAEFDISKSGNQLSGSVTDLVTGNKQTLNLEKVEK